MENSIFQEKARRVIEAPGGRVSESGARPTCIFCPRLRRWQTGAAAGWEGRGGPAKPPDPKEQAEPWKSSEDLALRDLRTPESPPGQGEGLGSDPGSLNSPATGRVKGSEEREVCHHSGSAGTASSGFLRFGASES